MKFDCAAKMGRGMPAEKLQVYDLLKWMDQVKDLREESTNKMKGFRSGV
jgi:hypothetical protein